MKKIMIFVLLLGVSLLFSAERMFTDMCGRTKKVPLEVKKVYSSNPLGTIYLYCLAPQKTTGLNYAATKKEKKYLLRSFCQLPILGGNFGGRTNTTNYEQIIKLKTDVVLSFGNICEESKISADALEKKLGIPVLVFDVNIDKIDESYLKMGELLGEEKRAKLLADYSREILERTKKIAANIPEEKRVKAYYAEGNDGLETDPSGSVHSELLDFVGGINVAKVQAVKGYGRAKVSMEQVLNWNPELLIACTDKRSFNKGDFFEKVFKSQLWTNVKAIKDKQVYQIPYEPYNFFDRPPSTNRIIGIVWLSNLLYPKYFDYDIKAEVKKFYKLFYHRELNSKEVNAILDGSIRK